MAGLIAARLAALDIELPVPALPVAAYVPYTVSGSLLVVSGQLPIRNGTLQYRGRLGDAVTLEDGFAAARLCGLNILAQAGSACGGDLDRIGRCLRLAGFVCATPEFTDHPKVINGASELMVDVLGEAGRHARVAVGVPSLPLGASVEIEALFELR